MVGGISGEKDKYNDLFYVVVRYAALLSPILIAPYALLAEFELVPRSALYSTPLTVGIFAVTIAVAIWQFIGKQNTRALSLFYVPFYHVFAALLLVFVTGFLSPMTYLWFLLLTITDLFFGKKGAIYSLAILVGLAYISLAQTAPSFEALLTHGAYILVIAISYAFTERLRAVHTIEHGDLVESQEKQKSQKDQLMTLINSVSEAIISTNTNGVIEFYNAAALDLLDTNASIIGQPIDTIIHTYDDKGEPYNLSKYIKGTTKTIHRDDLEHRFGDGEAIKIGLSISVVRSNTPSGRNKAIGYILAMRDITKSKSLEEERDEFISVVSHELRTPITIAEGSLSNLQILADRDVPTKTMAKPLTDAHEQIIYLAKMVNDLSTLSRAERGLGDEPETIDVATLLHDLYTEYEPKAGAKGLALNLDAHGKLGSVNVSRLYLEEVLQNFITNAIKYTQEGSVTLAAAHRAGNIEISVADTGIGISKSDQKRMFEKFYRSEDYRTRETSGTGLGLYIVQKLSHRIGADLTFTSRLNHGSTFRLTLKAAERGIDETGERR